MSYEVRKYQEDQIEAIVKAHAKHRTVCAQLPTGGGKTVMFSKLAHRYYHATGKAVLILVHREELMYQTVKTMKDIFDEEMPVIKAGTNWVRFAPAYIGMAESVYRRIENMPKDIGLIIVDEAHNAMFNKHLKFFTKEYITGFTATPKSSSKKEPLNKYYGDIVVGPQIKELIAMGNLSQNITRAPKDIVDRARLAMASTGDYDIQAMANEYKKSKYVTNTLTAYMVDSMGKKAIIYNVNIEHSIEVYKLFNAARIPCRHVDGTTPDNERAEIFKWFKETPNAVLCNVGVATMGFDEPTVETIIVNRATTSMPLWLQMCGRGSRPIDEFVIQKLQPDYPYKLTKKKSFQIIDMGGNCITHGDWSDDRDWRYIFDNPDIPGAGVAPMKECPSCGGLVHTATLQCKLPCPTEEDPDAICGHIFDRKKYEENEILEEFIVINEAIDLEAMLRFNKNHRNYFVFFELGRKLIDESFVSDIDLADERRRNVLFIRYMELVDMWFKRVFPEKYYNRPWHQNLARTYFDKYLNAKLKTKAA